MDHPLLTAAVRDFRLRNEPYDIQRSFMNDMLKCFDSGSVGFFESPTGTGKSLSVLCASVAYIMDRNKGMTVEPAGSDDDSDSEFDMDDVNKPTRLIVATRTHSQIKELVSELKRLQSAIPGKMENLNQQILAIERNPTTKSTCIGRINSLKSEIDALKDYRKGFPHCVSLASRKLLCVNSEFAKLSAAELNDQCGTNCAFHNGSQIAEMAKRIFETPMDIEDLVSYGNSRRACPYFSCRRAMHRSQIVFVPYQTLFHSGTRETLGLSLRNTFVVVDEAHNLVDALNALYTVKVGKEGLQAAFNRLVLFRKNSCRGVSGDEAVSERKILRNKMVIESKAVETANATRLINCTTSLTNALKIEKAIVMSLNQFQIDNRLVERLGNPFSLVQWAKDRRLLYTMCHSLKDHERVSTTEACRDFLEFVEAMGNTDDKGSIVIDPRAETLTYLLLNPSTVFEEVAKQTNGIVLVGGTLRPFDDVTAQLTTSASNVMLHCNGHVIPKENCLVVGARCGPNENRVRFTHETRNSREMMTSIAKAVVDLVKVVPNGVIIFFTSFEYMKQVHRFIEENGYVEAIEAEKFLLTETKESKDLDRLMRLYRSHIDNSKGAVLFAVINAKLSEGINFAHEYCRCVMVVGMPFADRHDVVLQQRMSFFDALSKDGKSSCNGHQFYVNQCMRAVNQAIGRSFRNITDYASVVLFDERYDDNSKLLPEWIQTSYSRSDSWSSTVSGISTFFADKK